MVDSTNLADEPAADLVAYYCDGIYATSEAAVRARFPNAVPVSISAIGTNSGVVGDVETGCMTPAQGAAWVRMRRAAGIDPTLYVNDSNWAATRAACAAAGVAQPHWWEAHYDGVPALTPGTIAKQYENAAMTGGHFDRSVVADFWPGVDNVFGPGGGSAGDHMDLSNPIDKIVYDSVSIIKDGLFKQDAAAGILAADGSHVAIQDAIANTLADVLTLTAKVDALSASVAATKPGAAPDLSAVQASLIALNAKVDMLAGTVLKIETALKGA